MKLPTHVQKYLSKQKNTIWKLETNDNKLFNNIIIVPALDELNNVKILINSLSLNSKKYLDETLIVFVVNNCVSEKIQIIKENHLLLNYLREMINGTKSNLNVGLIDACSINNCLPDKYGGVGFARKIGMDLALNYFDYSNENKKILISLDADCLVSDNYLQSIVEEFNSKNINAAVVNFKHMLSEYEDNKAAIINYEIFLRYYVLGLKYAGSHFAYTSVGSIIACDVDSYIKVGGMNKRKAGEDFYFLEKLAKLGTINKIRNATVFPSSRVSERVPFGTGPRIKRFLSRSDDEYLLYSPESFEVLKNWLQLYESIRLSNPNKNDYLKDLDNLLDKTKVISQDLYNFLISQKFKEDWNNILFNSKSELQISKQKLNWMDGFRTLKLIHYLRDNNSPNKNMFEAIEELFNFMEIKSELNVRDRVPPIGVQFKYLELLRNLT